MQARFDLDERLGHGIKSARFDLEPLSPQMAPLIADLAADTEVVKNLVGDWSTEKKRLDNARGWIDDDHYLVIWGVHDRTGAFGEPGEFIGLFGVEKTLPEAGQGPSIFYAYRQKVWGQGVASEVAAIVIDFLFSLPSIGAIEALVLPRVNRASEHLLVKQGMKLVGRYPMAIYVGEDSLSTVRYEIWRAQVAVPADAQTCIAEAALKIGQFVRDGIVLESEAKQALLVSAHENGLVDLIGIDATRSVIGESLGAGKAERGWLHYRLERVDWRGTRTRTFKGGDSPRE